MEREKRPYMGGLERVLGEQYEPRELAEALDGSLRAVVYHALATGICLHEAMAVFEAVMSLRNAVLAAAMPDYAVLNLAGHGDSGDKAAA